MKQTTQRGLSGVLIPLILLSLVPLAFVPTATALTWSGAVTVAIADREAARFDGDTSRTGNIMVVWKLDDAGGVGLDRVGKSLSSDGGTTWGSVTAVDTLTTIGIPDIVNLGGDDFQVCIGGAVGDGSSGVQVHMYRTDDGGSDWTQRTGISSPSGAHDTCNWGRLTTSKVALSYFSSLTTIAVNRLSADNTDTFGAFTTIATQAAAERVENFARKTDDSESWAWAVGTLGMCITVDNGATFTCSKPASNPTALAANLAVVHLGGENWMMIGTGTALGDDVYYAKTFDDGASWTVPALAFVQDVVAGGETIGDLRAWAVNSEEVHVVYSTGVGTTTLAGTVAERSTTNQGSTWSSHIILLANHACNGINYPVRSVDLRTVDGLAQVLVQEGSSAGGFGGCGASFEGRTYFYEAEYAPAGTEGGSIGALSSVAVSNLVGFDVSPSGNSLVTRYGATGVSVATYSSFSLGQLGTTGTDCSTTDRVLASDRGVIAYVSCDVGTGDADKLKMRTVTFGVFPFENCPDCDADGADDLSFDEWLYPADTQLAELGELLEFPWTFENTAGNDNRGAYAWSANDGTIGVNTYIVDNFGANGAFSTRSVFSGSGVDQLCAVTWRGSDNFLGAVRSGASTQIYRVTFSALAQPSLIGPQTLPSARGIGCAEDRVLLEMNDQAEVRLYNTTTATQVWAITGLALQPTRAVAFSDNGDWCAYAEQTTVTICDASNGTTVATVALRSGDFKSISLSRAGQFLWVATSTGIDVFDIHTETTGESVSDSEGGGSILDPGDDVGEGPFAVPPIEGVSEFGGSLLFGIIVVVGMTVGLGAVPFGATRGRVKFSIALAIIGAILGFFMAWGLGYFSDGVVFGIIVLAAVGVSLRLWIGRGASDG